MRSREDQRREREAAFGDAVYDAWRSGLNSDEVSRERVTEFYYDTYDRHAAADAEVAYLRRQHEQRTKGPEDEQEDPA